MEINKNIAVWRGNSAPPTQYHLWQKGDALLHYNGTEWVLNNFPISTPDEDGLMSKEDKAKLDNLVYDGVDSDRGDIALSARQGRILSEKITDLNTYVYKPKGSVQEIQDLPLDNLRIGDVYNIINPFYIEDKKYPAGTNVVWIGSEWDPLGGTVNFSDYSTTEEVEGMIEEQRQEIGAALQDISLVLYNQHSYLTLRVSPTIIEQGVDTPITIQWGFKFNDVSMNPDTIRVLENSSEISTDTSTKVISRSINSTTNYVVQASLKGVTKVQQTTVNAYYPMYFGSSSLDQITDVTTLTKQALKASPSGTYNISVNENEYIWWCIPNTMTINSIKSGGFEVPIEAPIVIDNYKCYRTSSRLKAGIINCVIS